MEENIVLSQEELEYQLGDIVPLFYMSNTAKNTADKQAKSYNSQIKLLMERAGLSEFVIPGYEIKVTERPNSVMDEEKAVEILKELGMDHLLVTKVVIDQDAVERAIYNGEIPATALTAAIVENEPTKVLKVKKAKEN